MKTVSSGKSQKRVIKARILRSPKSPALTSRNYSVNIHYSEEDGCYIATSPSWPYLSAGGSTIQKAAKELYEAIDLALESSAEHGDPVPAPDPLVARLVQLQDVLNTRKVAKLSGINENTFRSKLRRDSGFNKTETKAIKKALTELGVGV